MFNFLSYSAFFVSMSLMMEVRDPMVSEKKITPANIAMIDRICSVAVLLGMSPYPTVITV